MMHSPLSQWAASQPLQVALSDEHHSYTWAQLDQQVATLAQQLTHQGLGAKDVIAAVGKNSLTLLKLYLACIEVGAILAPIAPAPWPVLQQKFTTVEPKAVLWQDAPPPQCGYPRLQLAHQPEHGLSQTASISECQLTSLIFTSGSSGAPKAVAHTIGQHLASAKGLLSQFEFTAKDSWLLSLPMYHVSGLAIVWRWLAVGATLVMTSSRDLVEDLSQVSHASLVATQLLRALGSGQPLGLKRVLLGGSHIPADLCQRARELGIDTWLGYGMTEAASTVTAKQTDSLATAGYVLPQRELTVLDGRIYIRGSTLAAGYYRHGALTPLALNDQGWFDTKDLGGWQQSQLKVLGRADNQFISGGENIHCEEIEAVLNTHPKVSQCYIVPVADKEFGQRPVAVLVAEALLDKAEYDAFIQTKLTKFKWPIAYHLMPPELLGNGIKIPRKAIANWLQGKL